MFTRPFTIASSLINSIRHPTDGTSVANIAELTGSDACKSLLLKMMNCTEGRLIVKEKPLVTGETMRALASDCPNGSLGKAYLDFMDKHRISADTRAPIRWMDQNDPRSYILLRYRQIHDLWHVLAGDIPISIEGELALKWMEFFQTGLPMTFLAGTVAPSFLLDSYQRSKLWKVAIPWALRNSPPHTSFLLSIYYEKHLHEPLISIQNRLGIIPFPKL